MSIAARIDERPVLDVLDRMLQAAQQTEAPLDEAGQHLVSEITLLFRSSTSPYGRRWPPSARVRDGGKTLVDRGHLRDSVNHKVAGDTLTLGASMDYARAHNEGIDGQVVVAAHRRLVRAAFGRPLETAVRARVRQHTRRMQLPQRQFIPTDGLPPDWSRDVIEILQDHIVRAANG